jgi:hypothetical protein
VGCLVANQHVSFQSIHFGLQGIDISTHAQVSRKVLLILNFIRIAQGRARLE